MTDEMKSAKKRRGTSSKKHTVTSVRKAIYEAYGIKTAVAKALDVSRQTLDNYLMDWPELEADLLKAREGMVDEAETGLQQLVAAGNVKAIIFILSTLGKNRGYATRTEITGADGRPVLELSPELLLLMQKLKLNGADILRALTEELKAAGGDVSG